MSAQLGERYRDPITAFEGTATARMEYLGGRVSICLERGNATSVPETAWIDEHRLVPPDGTSVGFGTP